MTPSPTGGSLGDRTDGSIPVSVAVLAYGDEPYLQKNVLSILGSRDVDVELILVDNGSPEVSLVAGSDERITVITPADNLGFAGGCNAAAAAATREILVFVNSDVILEEDSIRVLVDDLLAGEAAIVSGAILLADDPVTLNSAGNPIHYLLFSWSGEMGEPLDRHRTPGEVAGFSGCFFAVARDTFAALGGFEEVLFAYNEDADLSLRCWQRGLSVRYVPDATAHHFYDFYSKSVDKWYLLERNRLINVLTLYERSSLLALLPVVVLTELGVLAVSVRDGWWRQKVRGWWWLLGHRRFLAERRAAVSRQKTDSSWVKQLSARVEISKGFGMSVPSLANAVLERYFSLVRGILR